MTSDDPVGHHLKLYVQLKDGRVLSGTYPYLIALERKIFAESLPPCQWAETFPVRRPRL